MADVVTRLESFYLLTQPTRRELTRLILRWQKGTHGLGATQELKGETHAYYMHRHMYPHKSVCNQILHSGKISRENTFANFKVLWLFTKVFSTKFGGVASFSSTSKYFVKVFFHENLTFHQFTQVSFLHVNLVFT